MDALRRKCVQAFPTSTTRERLFTQLELLTTELQATRSCSAMWVNGSFLTTKRNPRDIDVVVLIDDEAYNEVRPMIEQGIENGHLTGLDIQIVQVYPIGHRLRYLTDLIIAAWITAFGESRDGIRKGIAVIRLRGEP